MMAMAGVGGGSRGATRLIRRIVALRFVYSCVHIDDGGVLFVARLTIWCDARGDAQQDRDRRQTRAHIHVRVNKIHT